MPITLPSSFDDRELPHGTDDYIWLVEILVKKSTRVNPTTFTNNIVLRVCSDTNVITWPIDNPIAQTWSPFNFKLSPMVATGEGDLPSLHLTVDNTGRVLMPTLHDGDAVEGNDVIIYLVPRSALSIAYPAHEYQRWKFVIASVAADSQQVTFQLERANFFTKMCPQDRFVARRCRWKFGSNECGYVINSSAAYTTCEKTVSDCTLRGEDHLARGLPVIHPGRFGGFPGIPKRQ